MTLTDTRPESGEHSGVETFVRLRHVRVKSREYLANCGRVLLAADTPMRRNEAVVKVLTFAQGLRTLYPQRKTLKTPITTRRRDNIRREHERS